MTVTTSPEHAYIIVCVIINVATDFLVTLWYLNHRFNRIETALGIKR